MGRSVKLHRNSSSKKKSSTLYNLDDPEEDDIEKYRPVVQNRIGALKSVRLTANTPVPFQANLPSHYDVGLENPSMEKLVPPADDDLNQEEEAVLSSIGNNQAKFAISKKAKKREQRAEYEARKREEEEEVLEPTNRYYDPDDVDRPLYEDEDVPVITERRKKKKSKRRPDVEEYAEEAPAEQYAEEPSYAEQDDFYAQQEASIEAEEREKADLLHRLSMLKNEGIPLTKKRGYTEKDSLQTLRVEWGRLQHMKSVFEARSASYHYINGVANGLEILQNQARFPSAMRGYFSGIGSYVKGNISEYDDAISRLAEQYGSTPVFSTSGMNPWLAIGVTFMKQLCFFAFQRYMYSLEKGSSSNASADVDHLVTTRVEQEAKRLQQIYQQQADEMKAQIQQLQKAHLNSSSATGAAVNIQNPLYASTPSLTRTFANQANEANMFARAMQNEQQMAAAVGAPPPLYAQPMQRLMPPPQPMDIYHTPDAGRPNDKQKSKEQLPPGPVRRTLEDRMERRPFNTTPIITEGDKHGEAFKNIGGQVLGGRPVPPSLRLDQIISNMKKTPGPPPPINSKEVQVADPFAHAFPASYVDSAPKDDTDSALPSIPKEQMLIVTPEPEISNPLLSSDASSGTRKSKNLRLTAITDSPPVIAALIERQKMEVEQNNMDGNTFIREVVPTLAPNESVKVSPLETPEESKNIKIDF